MNTLNDFFKTDDLHDVMAAGINDLIASSLRSEYSNVETLAATRTLLDADTPIQRFDCDGADRIVKMPTENTLDNHLFLIVNDTGTGSYRIFVQDNAGSTTYMVLSVGDAVLMLPNGDGGYVRFGTSSQYLLRDEVVSQNLLQNGSFYLNQRYNPSSLTTVSNGSYWADRWFTQHDASGGSGAQFRRWQLDDASIPSPQPTYADTFAQIRNSGSSAAGILWSQPLESYLSAGLRGKTMILTASAMASSGTPTLKFKVFAWSGTRDNSGCRNLVASWSGAHAPTFNTTTLTELASGSLELSSSVWQQTSVVLSTPASGARNLTVCFWVENLAVGDSIYFSEADLRLGNLAGVWQPKTPIQELLDCQRYFFKTFAVDTAPAQNAGATGAFRFMAGKAGAGNNNGSFAYPVAMRSSPTLTFYNPNAANAQARDATASADCSGTQASGSANHRMCGVFTVGNASTAVGNALDVHITADAEI